MELHPSIEEVKYDQSFLIDYPNKEEKTWNKDSKIRMDDILLVDDDDSCRRLSGEVLHDMGYRYQEAANGAEALTILQNSSIHLVLSDLEMPVMNGLQLLECMQKDPSLLNIPVIIITGQTDSEVLQDIKQ